MRLKQTLVIVVLMILSMVAPAIVSYTTKAQSATPIPAGATTSGYTSKLTPAINALISQPKYKHAQWGILVSDRKTGEVIYELNPEQSPRNTRRSRSDYRANSFGLHRGKEWTATCFYGDDPRLADCLH